MSTTPKFSPGPWSGDDCAPSGLIDANGAKVSFVIGPRGRANRKLRNAAPDLYDALDEILTYSGGADNALEDEYVMERARAALRKARGEQ